MPCISIPKPTIPEFPNPFKLPSLPPFPPVGTPGICCVLPPFQVLIPTIALPGTLNVATVAALNSGIAAANAFIDALGFDCPKN